MSKRQTPPPSRLSTFIDGAINGAINGALMLGIFASLMLGASAIPALGITYSLGTAISTWGIGTLATSLFGGVASVRKEHKESQYEKRDARIARAHSPETTAPAVAVAASVSSHPDKVGAWRDRVGKRRNDDTSFAKALEDERTTAAQRQHGVS
jgi:hypothetical protein